MAKPEVSIIMETVPAESFKHIKELHDKKRLIVYHLFVNGEKVEITETMARGLTEFIDYIRSGKE